MSQNPWIILSNSHTRPELGIELDFTFTNDNKNKHMQKRACRSQRT